MTFQSNKEDVMKFYEDTNEFRTEHRKTYNELLKKINSKKGMSFLNTLPKAVRKSAEFKSAKQRARVGMVVGHKDYLNSVLKVKSNMDSGMYFGIQKGAIEALSLSSDWFDSMNLIYKERRAVIWKICDILGYIYDKESSGLFVWAKIPDGKKSEEITDMILYDFGLF